LRELGSCVKEREGGERLGAAGARVCARPRACLLPLPKPPFPSLCTPPQALPPPALSDTKAYYVYIHSQTRVCLCVLVCVCVCVCVCTRFNLYKEAHPDASKVHLAPLEAGHCPHHEVPEAVASEVKTFMAQFS